MVSVRGLGRDGTRDACGYLGNKRRQFLSGGIG